MKNVRSLLIMIVCISLPGVAFSQLHQVDATASDGLDSGAETERVRLIAALPWLANCTAESTDPCDAPFDAEEKIKSHLPADGVGFNFLCWLFPHLPWCHKRIPTSTTNAETTAPTRSTGTMKTLATTSRTSAGTTAHTTKTKTSTSATTESTATGSKVTTTSGRTSSATESTKHRRTTRGHHTTHSPSHHTTGTTTRHPSSTVNPSGDDKFNVKWFFVGFATMFGVAIIILLIALLFVRYRRAHPSGGYSALGSD